MSEVDNWPAWPPPSRPYDMPAPPAAGPSPYPHPGYTASAQPGSDPDPLHPTRTKKRRGMIGSIVAAAAAVAKFGAVLVKLKYAAVIISMVVSVAAYTALWGPAFAVGFVLLLFVHEMGHALEMRRQGIPASAPMFIPFMGAVISMRGRPASAYQEATVGLAGPAFGTAISAAAALMASSMHSDLLRALAFTGFLLNLFNLLPALPLDGGRAVAALHPALWLAGLAGLVGVEIWRPTPIIPVIAVLGGIELARRWKQRRNGSMARYYSLTAGQRTFIACSYLGLVAVCVAGMNWTYLARTFN